MILDGAGGGVLFWAAHLTLVLLLLSLLLAVVRLAIGPSLPDRVVALDLFTLVVLALVGVFTIASDQRVYLDVGLALALIAFLATVAFAWYAERRAARFGAERRPDDVAAER